MNKQNEKLMKSLLVIMTTALWVPNCLLLCQTAFFVCLFYFMVLLLSLTVRVKIFFFIVLLFYFNKYIVYPHFKKKTNEIMNQDLKKLMWN